jgi:hypothetical protein
LIVEGDELWSYVGKRSQKVWVWFAQDRHTREILGYILAIVAARVRVPCGKLCRLFIANVLFVTPISGRHTKPFCPPHAIALFLMTNAAPTIWNVFTIPSANVSVVLCAGPFPFPSYLTTTVPLSGFLFIITTPPYAFNPSYHYFFASLPRILP